MNNIIKTMEETTESKQCGSRYSGRIWKEADAGSLCLLARGLHLRVQSLKTNQAWGHLPVPVTWGHGIKGSRESKGSQTSMGNTVSPFLK